MSIPQHVHLRLLYYTMKSFKILIEKGLYEKLFISKYFVRNFRPKENRVQYGCTQQIVSALILQSFKSRNIIYYH